MQKSPPHRPSRNGPANPCLRGVSPPLVAQTECLLPLKRRKFVGCDLDLRRRTGPAEASWTEAVLIRGHRRQSPASMGLTPAMPVPTVPEPQEGLPFPPGNDVPKSELGRVPLSGRSFHQHRLINPSQRWSPYRVDLSIVLTGFVRDNSRFASRSGIGQMSA